MQQPTARHAVTISLGNQANLRALARGQRNELRNARTVIATSTRITRGDLLARASMRVSTETQQERFHVTPLRGASGTSRESEANVENILQRCFIATVIEPEAAVVDQRTLVGANLSIRVAQRSILAVLRLVCRWRSRDINLLIGASDPRVTIDAGESGRSAENLRSIKDGLPSSWITRTARTGDHATNDRNGSLQRVVNIAVWVWTKGERRNIVLHAGHLSHGDFTVTPLQMDVRLIELSKIILLAAPVERLGADDSKERLRRHRSLHRVPTDAARYLARFIKELHGALGITNVPRHAIAPRIHMARCAA